MKVFPLKTTLHAKSVNIRFYLKDVITLPLADASTILVFLQMNRTLTVKFNYNHSFPLHQLMRDKKNSTQSRAENREFPRKLTLQQKKIHSLSIEKS